MFLRLLSYYFIPSFILIYYLFNSFQIINKLSTIILLSIISWTISYYLFEYFNKNEIIKDLNNKIVLITGCDSGFGNRLAHKLDQLGFIVYAGVLFPDGDGSKYLKANCSNRLNVIKMDVTKKDDVDLVYEKIKSNTNRRQSLWAIVNNAGIGYSTPFDWGEDLELYQKTFDVNVFGVVRCTKKFIPLLRQSNNGRIINVASVAGRISCPWMGHYCMSKHSVRSFSDTIRKELYGTNIKVVTIEPSFYRTQIVNFELLEKARENIFNNHTSDDIRNYYGENFLKYLKNINRMINLTTSDNIDEVIDSMIDGIIKKYPKTYYRCCSYHELFTLWAMGHLPEIIVDFIVGIYLKLGYRHYKCCYYQDNINQKKIK